MSRPKPESSPALSRWRQVLGQFCGDRLPSPASPDDQRREQALDFLYGQEYQGRGVRHPGDRPAEPQADQRDDQGGSLSASRPDIPANIPHWISEVRELFPRNTVERIEKHALERYELTELLTDAEVLSKLTPNLDLLKTLLTFRGQLQGKPLLTIVRRIVKQVVDELQDRLEADLRRSLLGQRSRRPSPLKIAQNLDWRSTIRGNLQNYDAQQQRLLVESVKFFSRVERRLPWHILLCIDQSGSMADSVIHSAVMGGILAKLPTLKVSFLVFDTAVVDLSHQLHDPVELLLSCQLGGGTHIAQVLAHSQTLIDNPQRTAVILITDFAEGGSPTALQARCKQLKESGVTLLGLAALDGQAKPYYDRRMAEKLAACGMEIAALTPQNLAAWLARTIS